MTNVTHQGLNAIVSKTDSFKLWGLHDYWYGEVIVEDELLNFLAVKIKTMIQDEIILLASNMFDCVSSKKMLFDFCPTTQRCVSEKEPQKDINNKSCLKVRNGCGENNPDLSPIIGWTAVSHI